MPPVYSPLGGIDGSLHMFIRLCAFISTASGLCQSRLATQARSAWEGVEEMEKYFRFFYFSGVKLKNQ